MRAPLRFTTIDAARALAVIGVVLSHAVDGLVNAGVSRDGGALASINETLYLIRMPALAFVLGLFALGGIRKRGRLGYIRARAVLAGYVYIIWFFLQTTVEVLTSGLKNYATPPSALLEIWVPPAQLWFLPYLIVSSVVCALLAPTLERHGLAVVLGFALLSTAVWQWNPNLFGARGLSLLAFTLAGAALGQHKVGASLNRRPGTWAIGGVLAGLGLMALKPIGLTSGTAPRTLESSVVELSVQNLASVTASALGVAMLLGAAVVVTRAAAVEAALTYIGQRTLEVYLAHVIVVAGARIALLRLGVANEWFLVAVLLLLGVAIPLLLAETSRRLKCPWLFDLPSILARWADRKRRVDPHYSA